MSSDGRPSACPRRPSRRARVRCCATTIALSATTAARTAIAGPTWRNEIAADVSLELAVRRAMAFLTRHLSVAESAPPETVQEAPLAPDT